MDALLYLLSLSAGIAGTGLVESMLYRKRLNRIPSRIHVSGTRGKSSVTRLIAAGLNGNGRRTVAKTTGTLPKMILPDGREVPVFRPIGANIMEQSRIVSAASRLDAEVLVIECMALLPELHWISEKKFIRATHGVITNIRADHLDVMGPGTRDVALAISGMIPVAGKLFTCEQTYLEELRFAADDRKTELIPVTNDEIEAVTEEEISGFSYTEHKENLALSIRVLSDFGIGRLDAVKAMWKVQPDPGVLTEHKLDFFGRKIVFVNAFAANDPESTEKIWNMMRRKYNEFERYIVVLNLREDRPVRTLQFVERNNFWHDADSVVLMGSGSYLFSRMATKKTDYPASRFIYTEQDGVDGIFEKIIDASGKSALVIGVGNIGEFGLPLVRYFRNREYMEAG